MKTILFAITIMAVICAAGCAPAQSADSSHAQEATLEQQPAPTSTAAARSVLTDTPAPHNTPASVASATVKTSATTTGPDFRTTPTKTMRNTPVPSLTPLQSPTGASVLGADDWKELPVIPAISDEALIIYARGLEAGNNPLAFSKIGDCGSTPAWFLGDFDRGARFYRLGEFEYLEDVIQYFQGSFDRTSLAARSGFNASALFVPLWADREFCKSDETPLACEYRVHKPIAAFIMLGSNDVWRPDEFEPQMRKIIEFSIDQGVIPILATKADNQEKDGSINAAIARLAQEYKLPLWNYWKAVNELPDGGLQEDGVHLTWGANHFDDPGAMSKAWPIRNLTALQILYQLWQKVNFHD